MNRCDFPHDDHDDSDVLRQLERLESRAHDIADDAARARLELRIATLRMARGEVEAARPLFARAVQSLLRAGWTQRAAAAIDRLLAMPPGDPDRERELGGLALDAGLLSQGPELLVRAAETHRRRGDRGSCREVLQRLEGQLYTMPPGAMRSLADGWVDLAEPGRAVEVLAHAAELWRSRDCPARAVELCRRAAELQEPCPHRLHRTWGLALMALDDGAAAVRHVERWVEAEPSAPEPRIWHAEALWSTGQREQTRAAVARLAEVLGEAAPGDGDGAQGELRRAIERRLATSGETLANARLAPFWEAEELVGPDPRAESAAEAAEVQAAVEGEAPPRRPRIFVADDTFLFRRRLSEILQEAGMEVVVCPADLAPDQALRQIAPVPDLLILPVFPADPSTVATVREIRSHGPARAVPVLGLTTVDRRGLDLEALRAMGVDGLVDKSCIPEHLVFRVNQLVRRPRERRGWERAPAFFPVDLEAEGAVTPEYALNLSLGGMRVTSTHRLEPNTDVRVRFQLASQSSEIIEAKGRVIYCSPREVASGPYEVGLFFYPFDARVTDWIEHEVQRLLEE